MKQDVNVVTQQMLRKWHEDNFPGLPPFERASRLRLKLVEEFHELEDALSEYGDTANILKRDPATLAAVKAEAADVFLVLMSLAEFLGFNITREAIAKFNENTNRVWVEDTPDEFGFPRWKRERDNRPDILRKAPPSAERK